MRVHLSDTDLVPDLLRFLEQHVDVVAAESGNGTVEVSILGSRRLAANRAELHERLQPWLAVHAGVELDVEE